MLVDTLIKIKDLQKSEQFKLALVLLRTDKTFAKYMRLCYGDEVLPRKCFSKFNVEYRKSEAPLGMDFGSLESVYGKFSSCAFNIDDGAMSDDIAKVRLVQVFEVLNKHEVIFLKEIMKGKYSGLSKTEYKSATLE